LNVTIDPAAQTAGLPQGLEQAEHLPLDKRVPAGQVVAQI